MGEPLHNFDSLMPAIEVGRCRCCVVRLLLLSSHGGPAGGSCGVLCAPRCRAAPTLPATRPAWVARPAGAGHGPGTEPQQDHRVYGACACLCACACAYACAHTHGHLVFAATCVCSHLRRMAFAALLKPLVRQVGLLPFPLRSFPNEMVQSSILRLRPFPGGPASRDAALPGGRHRQAGRVTARHHRRGKGLRRASAG